MNFGFRLPGPFRVGVSDSGRVNVGATAGPFSVSTSLSSGRPGMLLPLTLDQFVAQARAEGFSVQVTPHTSAHIERRWQAATADVVPGRGVTVKRTLSTWTIVAIIAAITLPVLLCCGPALWSASQT